MIHDNAFFRFNDGDFSGKKAIRGTFEKTWKDSANVRKARFYQTDFAVAYFRAPAAAGRLALSHHMQWGSPPLQPGEWNPLPRQCTPLIRTTS